VKANKRFRHVIWLATTWSLWRARNNILFRGETVNISLLVDQLSLCHGFGSQAELVKMFKLSSLLGVLIP
jgi:hypothetical protein